MVQNELITSDREITSFSSINLSLKTQLGELPVGGSPFLFWREKMTQVITTTVSVNKDALRIYLQGENLLLNYLSRNIN